MIKGLSYYIENGAVLPSYCLKSEVSVTLCFQPWLTHYTAVWTNSCSKSTSVIKVNTVKNTNNFHCKRSHHQNNTFYCRQRLMAHKGKHYCAYCDILPSRAEVQAELSKIIKLVIFSCYGVTLVWRHQLVSQSVGWSVGWSISQSENSVK